MGPLKEFTDAVDNAGFGKISLAWLLDYIPMWYRRPDKRPAHTEDNIVHINFGR